jgi:16S rRNA C1402 N4-methylase RsmH
MLYKETVETTTLELLASLQQEEILSIFFLIGDTALSLQIGHKISIDLDLFSKSLLIQKMY